MTRTIDLSAKRDAIREHGLDRVNIVGVGLFAQPKSWDELQRWLDRLSGSERALATTAAVMTWNLAAYYDGHNEATESARSDEDALTERDRLSEIVAEHDALTADPEAPEAFEVLTSRPDGTRCFGQTFASAADADAYADAMHIAGFADNGTAALDVQTSVAAALAIAADFYGAPQLLQLSPEAEL